MDRTIASDTTPPDTAEVIRLFNQAFTENDPALLRDLVADDCVMEAVDGSRTEGGEASLAFWLELVNNKDVGFTPEDVVVMGEHATIRWLFRFGPGESDRVRGVNLMRVRDGRIVEALGYGKNPPTGLPLPDSGGPEA